jgi:serine/threonine protein kinase
MLCHLNLGDEKEVRSCIRQFKALDHEAQTKQIESIGQIFCAALQRDEVLPALAFFEEMTEPLLCELLEMQGAALFRAPGNSQKSMWLYFLENAVKKARGVIVQKLLKMFIKQTRSTLLTIEVESFFSREARLGFACMAPGNLSAGIDFVSDLPGPLFDLILSSLRHDGTIFKNDDLGVPIIIRFFERKFEQLFRWMLAQGKSFPEMYLHSYCDLPSFSLAMRSCIEEKLKKKDFPFLYSLLNVFVGDRQRQIVKTIPRWVEEGDRSRSNFLHWLYSVDDPFAFTIIVTLIRTMPFEQLAWLYQAQNEDKKRPYEINAPRHGRLNQYVMERIESEYRVAKTEGLRFSQVAAFLFFMPRNASLNQLNQLLALIDQSRDFACRRMKQYLGEIESGWEQVHPYQNRATASPIVPYDRLELACLFASGPDVLSRACQKRRSLEKQIRDIIMDSPSNLIQRAMLRYFAAKMAFHTVTVASLDDGLCALSGKEITLEAVEPFFRKKLSVTQLGFLVGQMESSHDPRVQALLPARRAKLEFWQNFTAFLTKKEQEKKITFSEVEEVVRNLNGMEGRSFETSHVHIWLLEEVMEAYGDEKTRRLAKRFRTIYHAVTSKREPFELESPSKASVLAEAYFIETELPRLKIATDTVLSRRATGLGHLLQYNPETKRVYLLGRLDCVTNVKMGTFKLATPAFEFRQDDLSLFARKIRLFTRSPKRGMKKEAFQAEIDHMHTYELAVIRRFRHHPNFNACLSIAEYRFSRSTGDANVREEVPRISLIVDPIYTTLSEFVVQKPMTFENRVAIMRALLQAVSDMHKEGIIHGDLKCENVLLGEALKQSDPLIPNLIDFGFSVPCEVGKPIPEKDLGNSWYNEGVYGSILMTPPELLGERNFSGDHFKVESFAMGFIMYYLINGKYPLWSDIPQAYYGLGCPKGDFQTEKKAALESAVKAYVQGIRKLLALQSATQAMSREERYMLLLAHLLEPDPIQRWTVNQALEEIGKLCVPNTAAAMSEKKE